MMTGSRQPTPPGNDQPADARQAVEPSDVLVFVDDAAMTETSVHHAQKVASAFGGKAMLVQVLCKPSSGNGPIDPVDWGIKKQQTLKRLGYLTKGSEGNGQPCDVELLEGQCISQIKAFMDHRQGDIAAFPRTCHDMGWLMSETAWGVLLSHSAAILMIPDDVAGQSITQYRRVLVPLDGSSRAETALPKAIQLARAETSELMLCYVAPEPGLTAFGAKDHETERLYTLVRKRNDQAGKTYLARIRKRLEHNDLKISARVSHSGDARRALIDVMSQENIDFVVMATHGQSGHRDVPTGDVARFVMDKASIPVLLVRCRNGRDGNNHAFGEVSPMGVRQPAGTD